MFKKYLLVKWLLISLYNAQIVYCFNYCSSTICNNTRQHTLCQYPVPTPGERCIELERIIQTSEVKRALLDKINSRRNKIASGDVRSFPSAEGMLKLEWNEELEKSAQRWADQCIAQDDTTDVRDTCRDLENMPVGQNIATVYGEAPGMSPLSLVDVWYTELLNTNSSVILRYTPSPDKAVSHYNYFTQLVWARSTEVGCGGVKFKERYGNSAGRNRTINRLVCNFAPSGNIFGESVYTIGPSCSRCPYASTCDAEFKALCNQNRNESKNTWDENEDNDKIPIKKKTSNYENVTEDENYFFDYLSHFFDFNRQPFTVETTQRPIVCKDVLAVDEFVDLLKKKLANDPIFKELLLSTKSVPNVNDYTLSDPNVAMFVSKIYSKKEMTTTTKMPESDYVNSTLLVDLVEAVIFRSGERTISTDKVDELQQSIIDVSPVKIQAELAEVKQNHDFTGHYFFPEDSTEESNTETINAYDDAASISVADVVLEIETLKRDRTTKDFLEDIIESDIMSESTAVSRKKRSKNIRCDKNNHLDSCIYKLNDSNIFKTKYSHCTDLNKSLSWKKYCKLLQQLALDLKALKLNERFSCSSNSTTHLHKSKQIHLFLLTSFSLILLSNYN